MLALMKLSKMRLRIMFSSPSSGDKLLAEDKYDNTYNYAGYLFSSPSSGDKLLAESFRLLVSFNFDEFSSPSSGDKLLAWPDNRNQRVPP